MIKMAYKVRIYPDEKQIKLLAKTFGCARYVFNHYLYASKNEYKDNHKRPNFYNNSKDLTSLKITDDFLQEVDKFALQNSLINLENSYKRFFEEYAKGNKKQGLPRFKKKTNEQSYTTTFTNNNISIEENLLKLPKLGKIEFQKSRDIEGKIKSVTLSKTITNEYYASINVELDKEILLNINRLRAIGIDLGIKDFATLSDGRTISNPKYLKKSISKIKKQQKRLSRKKKDSKNKEKQRLLLAKAHQKIANQRNDFLHKTSKEIAKNNSIVVVEKLQIKNMLKNHKLAQAIGDVSWSKFINYLDYKLTWNGGLLIQIDTFFPSSQLCSNCNFKNQEVKKLSVREWTCPECGTFHNRDLNASTNILKEGLRMLDSGEIDLDKKIKQMNKKPKSFKKKKDVLSKTS